MGCATCSKCREIVEDEPVLCIACAQLATRKPIKWVSSMPTKEGYYWMYMENQMYIVYVYRHSVWEGRWAMTFGGPPNSINGGKYLISDDPEDPGTLRSAEPIEMPGPPPVTPV